MNSKVIPLVAATLTVFNIAITIFYIYPNMKTRIPYASNTYQLDPVQYFLAAVPYGHWVSFEPRLDELREVLSFSKYVRHELYGLPTKQRPDGKCGNTTITSYEHREYRALCNPTGRTPCCHDNQCVGRDMDQCACAQCIDERREIHAEFARYFMCKSSHKFRQFTSRRSICDVMSHVTLHFYGDSLTDQVYLALLTKALGGNMTRLFAENTPKAVESECQGQRMYVKKCRRWMKYNWRFPNCDLPGKMAASLVNGTIDEDYLSTLVRRLAETDNSVMFVGVGLHFRLDISHVNDIILQRILEVKGDSRWPYVIVSGVHHWGVLRSPTETSDSDVRRFNQQLKTLVSQYGIAYFDTYELTRNVFSYDGTHYGRGVNQVKADILLNVIQILKQRSVQ